MLPPMVLWLPPCSALLLRSAAGGAGASPSGASVSTESDELRDMGFCTGGCGGGPRRSLALGWRFTAGRAGASRGGSRDASAEDRAADSALTLLPEGMEGAGGNDCFTFSGEDLCTGCV